ncbi:glycosyltransferase [Asticcacaulis sp. BYS171W]|uniref:Glycosyltransferase n=1 Tax=Asticcacaulis aquaticus TaxID=2984212 RepID=A0ABT5HTH1_9CAUL|nr:glycosyltransferase [Asticcacaulis aquaticus]MDC7683165.1 glycosyltransferase [Asticcacaulis aquaticus]
MRVLNLMLAKGRGGLETMALRYHEALKAEGFEVLSVGHADGVLSGKLNGADFTALNTKFTGSPLAALKLKAIAKKFQPDIVLAHGNRAITLAVHGWANLAPETVAVVHNFRSKPDIAKAVAAIAVSPAVAEALSARQPKLPVHLLENFTPLSMHPVKPFPLDVPVIGALGRLHVNKGFDVLIRAVGLLRDRGTEVHLSIAGDGPEKDSLQKLVDDLGLQAIVGFPGWIEPADGFMATCDLFVLSSRVEPFGLVLAEAMAAGVPVVSTGIDGPRHILLDGQLGRLVPPEDPDALADAMETVLADWIMALDRAHHAQAHALESYGLIAGRARLSALINAFGGQN